MSSRPEENRTIFPRSAPPIRVEDSEKPVYIISYPQENLFNQPNLPGMNRKTANSAFLTSLPVLMGYSTMGAAFGILLSQAGYGPAWALLMSVTIFSGSRISADPSRASQERASSDPRCGTARNTTRRT